MASKSCSFDITSETNLAEVQNACNQSMLEIRQRFDFKGSKSQVEIDMKTAEVKIISLGQSVIAPSTKCRRYSCTGYRPPGMNCVMKTHIKSSCGSTQNRVPAAPPHP